MASSVPFATGSSLVVTGQDGPEHVISLPESGHEVMPGQPPDPWIPRADPIPANSRRKTINADRSINTTHSLVGQWPTITNPLSTAYDHMDSGKCL